MECWIPVRLVPEANRARDWTEICGSRKKSRSVKRVNRKQCDKLSVSTSSVCVCVCVSVCLFVCVCLSVCLLLT